LQILTGPRLRTIMLLHHSLEILNTVVNATLCRTMSVMAALLVALATGLGQNSVQYRTLGITTQLEGVDASQRMLKLAILEENSLWDSMEGLICPTQKCSTKASFSLQTCLEDPWNMMLI